MLPPMAPIVLLVAAGLLVGSSLAASAVANTMYRPANSHVRAGFSFSQ